MGSWLARGAAAFGLLATAGCSDYLGEHPYGATPAPPPASAFTKLRLDGASEVPPNRSRGIGHGDVAFDPATRKLRYYITYGELTGPATAAHFHVGAPGENGPVTLDLNTVGTPPPTLTGAVVLNEEQVQALMAGRMYVNVHTKAHPGGEIRGQVSAP